MSIMIIIIMIIIISNNDDRGDGDDASDNDNGYYNYVDNDVKGNENYDDYENCYFVSDYDGVNVHD